MRWRKIGPPSDKNETVVASFSEIRENDIVFFSSESLKVPCVVIKVSSNFKFTFRRYVWVKHHQPLVKNNYGKNRLNIKSNPGHFSSKIYFPSVLKLWQTDTD